MPGLQMFLLACIIDRVANCPDGHAGPQCETRCTTNCYNKTCTLTVKGDITCTFGCKAGYFGDPCTMKCDEKCKRCHRFQRHNCTECWEDFLGPSCSERFSDTKALPDMAIAIIILVLFSVSCVLVMLFLVYRNHRKKRGKDDSNVVKAENKRRERALPPVPTQQDNTPEYCGILEETCLSEMPKEPQPTCSESVSFSRDHLSCMTEVKLLMSDTEIALVVSDPVHTAAAAALETYTDICAPADPE